MKYNKHESGRSMVEILGTLTIIGVLSIGGIAGYSYAMDKYRANTIINDIMLRAIDVNTQFDSTGDANLSEWPTITAGKYTIGLEADTIGIQVSDLPKHLCEMVFEGLINNATVKIGTTEYDSPTDDICGDINTMVFYVDDGYINADNTETQTKMETETTTDLPLPPLPCRDDTPLADMEGNCYSCDTELIIKSPNCSVCENRVDWGDGTCELAPPLPSTTTPETTTPTVSDTEVTIPEITTPGLGSSCYADSDCGQCQKCDYDYSSYPYQKVCVEDSQQSGEICGLPTGEVGPGGPIYQLGGGVCYQGNCVPSCYSSSVCNSGELCLPARQRSCSTHPYSVCQKTLTNEISISYTDENGINRNETWYEVYQMGLLASATLSCDAIDKELPSISDFVLDWDDGASMPTTPFASKQYTLNNRAKALFPKAGLHEGIFWTGNIKDSNACSAYMITTNGNVVLDGQTYYWGGILCKDKN